MAEPKITDLRKYLIGINKTKKKHVTSEMLSKEVGIYPEVINDTLSYFEPILKMDPDYNLVDLVPEIKNFILHKEEEHEIANQNRAKANKDSVKYTSIIDFVYKKLSAGGGMINRNAVLPEEDLYALKKVVQKEINKKKRDINYK